MTKIKITENNQSLIFNRKEVKGFIESEIVPKKDEVKSLLAKELSVSEDLIEILKIAGKFGEQKFAFSADIYKSVEDLNKMKLKKKKKGDKK